MELQRGRNIKNFKRFTKLIIVSVLGLFVITIVSHFLSTNNNSKNKRDYPEIVKEGVLKIAINTNHIDYFIYQGQPMGLQLEMLDKFADDHGLSLEIIVENNSDKGIKMLVDGECDILAQSIINTNERDLVAEFTIPIRQTKQVLVQRNDGNSTDLKQNPSKNVGSSSNSLPDLKLKTLYVLKGSANIDALKNMASEVIQNFYIAEIDSLTTEQMIKYVSEGVFNYVVCDYDIAKISQSYYPNIDIETQMSLPQNISWCVRPESEILLDTLNQWLGVFLKSDQYSKLLRKYINNNRILVDINSEFYSGNQGRICEFDNLFKKYSPIIGWDWRLLASLVYEESRFNTEAVSWAGASGIMQLLPVVYSKYEDPKLLGTEGEIYAGVKYLEFLYANLPPEVADSSDMLNFVLAAYNIGPGHVEDAQRLAKKYNKNPALWQDISYYLINLSNPKYYNDASVKHGYFPGIYSVDFVNSISKRYKHYVNIIPK